MAFVLCCRGRERGDLGFYSGFWSFVFVEKWFGNLDMDLIGAFSSPDGEVLKCLITNTKK